jgi:hypothetical protein
VPLYHFRQPPGTAKTVISRRIAKRGPSLGIRSRERKINSEHRISPGCRRFNLDEMIARSVVERVLSTPTRRPAQEAKLDFAYPSSKIAPEDAARLMFEVSTDSRCHCDSASVVSVTLKYYLFRECIETSCTVLLSVDLILKLLLSMNILSTVNNGTNRRSINDHLLRKLGDRER